MFSEDGIIFMSYAIVQLLNYFSTFKIVIYTVLSKTYKVH